MSSPTIALTTAEPDRHLHGAHSGPPLPPKVFFGFVIAVALVLLIALLSYQSLRVRGETADRVLNTSGDLRQLQLVLSSLKDAETSQRGFMLTGAERYLEPYQQSLNMLPVLFQQLRERNAGEPNRQQQINALEQLTRQKLVELEQTIVFRRQNETQKALEIVTTDRGKLLMDQIRTLIERMDDEGEQRLLINRGQWENAVQISSWVSWGGCLVLLILIVAAAFMTSRDYRAKQVEAWIQAGRMALGMRLQGEQTIEALGAQVLEFLANYLDEPAAALYVNDDSDTFTRVAAYAQDPEAPTKFRPGDGLLGQAVRESRTLHISDVPYNYLPVVSSLGRGDSLSLLIAPATIDGTAYAVLELGFFKAVTPENIELLDRVSEMLGIAIRTARDRSRLELLLAQTQAQAEELQVQQEELRVNNEELEEQSRALKESQGQLESQQVELEQINSQLEEHTQLLSRQKDELVESQALLETKAIELERSNQYKSEFLANMSHELRTPLNSSLIFAKLLADNKDRNLSDEQVRFAQTIYSAGNDLLALINDILDLSKIEAGKVDVEIESVDIAGLIDGIVQGFAPLAQQRNLALSAELAPQLPLVTNDGQRLGQILKNLISNALKFTDKGSVTIRVNAADNNRISFAVADTGIGIPHEQQSIIFDAFRQADGSTHRKYGGTGLGLSISRDLARLLGGELIVDSIQGKGSVFTLTVPVTLLAPVTTPAPAPAPVTMRITPTSVAPLPIAEPRPGYAPAVARTSAKTLLIIEDDVAFASILRDVAIDAGFHYLVVHTAKDGLIAARNERPSAIVLDINLPDGDGLSVLDVLKSDPETRHIPVHIVSVADHTQEALGRGAVGYALKPVAREQLVAALEKLETKLLQNFRRVLVVEDDVRQLESIRQLLQNGDVQITGVHNGRDALTHLQNTTFDCVVMDLNLPDMSGYELLQHMAEKEQFSFPPVIVYTGRSLTRDEEQHLRRFSKSIIIKDVRSPERLLDEVTLFLHQVESSLPIDRQRMLTQARHREATFEDRRILVVEDDARNIFALTSILEPKGARVEIARNGIEALRALENNAASGDNRFDLVLMDIMMPEMDGITAMQEIRKLPQWQQLPIIALTAKAMKDDQERCLAAGANDYIAKPLDIDRLLSLIRVWLSR